jgi:hypothetical protein
MTQPAPQQPHIPGLITANGVTPAHIPGAPVPAAQPGTTVPDPAAAAPVQQQPVAVSSAVQPAPAQPVLSAEQLAAVQAAGQQPVLQLPTQLLPPTTTATAVPGLATATVPGLNPAAPAAAPQNPAPAAAAPATPPQPPAQPPATGADADRGYPQGTPLEQMTGDQREAYWKYHSRKWQSRAEEKSDYDALKAKAEQYDTLAASQASQTEQQIAAARNEGYQQAAAKAAVVLVDAHVRAGLQTRLGPDQVEALAGNLNHQHFLAADGLSVDAAKVSAFVNTVAPQTAAPAATAPAVPAAPGALPVGVPQPAAQQPAQPVTGLPRALPDLGQGAQTTAPLDKLEAGRQAAKAFLAGGGSFR